MTKDSAAQATLPLDADTLPWWRQITAEPMALGIAALVIARPWRDGLTYPPINTYFLWGIIGLAAIWAARALLKAQPIRHGKYILPFALFILVGLVTGMGTVQVDTTYRAILYWTGNFFLFVLVSNSLRTRRAVGVVLGAFIFVALVNALYSIVHLAYILPFVRQAVSDNPSLLGPVFQTDQLNPQIAHRFEINRAFGTFLFPNALAGFLILGIPYTLGQAAASISVYRDLRKTTRENDPGLVSPSLKNDRMMQSAFVGVVIAATAALTIFFFYPVLAAQSGIIIRWSDSVVKSLFLLGGVPLLLAAPPLIMTRRHGWHYCWAALKAAVIPITVLVLSYTLLKTYSRGGILALVLAMILTKVFFFRRGKRLPETNKKRRVISSAFVLFALLCLLWPLGSAPQAQVSAQGQKASTEQSATAPAAAPTVKKSTTLKPEGIDLRLSDLLNSNTLLMRWGYWKVAWAIGWDNFLGGVGLGNFGTVYPQYRMIGTGGVQVAHNDFLQILCETGIFGFLFYTLFWALFLTHGARRIQRERDRRERWVLAGIYGGIIAFLLHSLIDFNFYNPSLAFFEFLMAGIFLARSEMAEESPAKSRIHQFAALAILVCVAVAAGAASRLFVSDYLVGGNRLLNVGDSRDLNEALGSGRFYLQKLPRSFDPQSPPWRSLTEIARFVPDTATISTFGRVGVPVGNPPTSLRPLGRGESPPRNAIVGIYRPKLATKAVEQGCLIWIERLEKIDRVYPHRLDIPQNLFSWYELLLNETDNEAKRHEYASSCVRWARECVARGPRQYWNHTLLGQGLLYLGSEEKGPKNGEYFLEATRAYEKAAHLYPIMTRGWRKNFEMLFTVRNAFLKAGDAKTGDELMKRALQADKIVIGLYNERSEYFDIDRPPFYGFVPLFLDGKLKL